MPGRFWIGPCAAASPAPDRNIGQGKAAEPKRKTPDPGMGMQPFGPASGQPDGESVLIAAGVQAPSGSRSPQDQPNNANRRHAAIFGEFAKLTNLYGRRQARERHGCHIAVIKPAIDDRLMDNTRRRPMTTKTGTLVAIIAATAVGGTALAVAGHAGHRDGGRLGFQGNGPLGVAVMEMFDAADADGDGALSQAEIDVLLGERHAAHDADGDGNLDLEEFSGLWHETTRPLTVRAFQMLDRDGNGIVTRAEYDRPLAGIVERLDRDGDGSLSMRERRDDDDDRGRWWDND